MDKFSTLRAVAFDLDGTLVDSAPGLTEAVDNALYALELPRAGEDRVITWIGNGADVLAERALCWALKEKAEGKGEPQPDDEMRRMMRKLFDRYYGEVAEQGSFLFPAVAETLAALKQHGVALALVTNKPTPFVRPILESLGLSGYFEPIIGGDDVENKKPHPEPILRVAERLGISPQALLFVGDSRNDIQAARAAGCPSVGMTYGYNYGEAIALSNPDKVLDRFHELLPLLGLPQYEHQE
ncbi:phosphoglycolate phosphatase [Enterobacteriaceae bacterium BIT-l23]|uniref:Phosphoglycolate phosphatase n=1 Tax=Jejubacter calystegiae TaxID=2579935 RepID=A0A4P8YFZ2_9ENTR|nr:phosphoglycolate phosphatase [Jejubacter calystegiae]NUU65638.1 phosphoglycolate phosphatase [Enterobacteriaceae bacterium BIT-l23]QCT18793.1 phosphoglycolate phosphatase [Jejubacter calystegiae]